MKLWSNLRLLYWGVADPKIRFLSIKILNVYNGQTCVQILEKSQNPSFCRESVELTSNIVEDWRNGACDQKIEYKKGPLTRNQDNETRDLKHPGHHVELSGDNVSVLSDKSWARVQSRHLIIVFFPE